MESFVGRNRRALLTLASAGAGAALVTCVSRPSETGEAAGPLSEGSHLTGDRGPEMVARARSLGREYEAKFGNCSQCTIAALQDALDFVPKNEHVFLAGSGLHGGAVGGGNANCGGFTGAGMVIGHLCGRSRAKFGDRGAAKRASRLIRQMAVRYEQAYGSVICREVREKAGRNCPEVVAQAAGWAAEVLVEEFSS